VVTHRFWTGANAASQPGSSQKDFPYPVCRRIAVCTCSETSCQRLHLNIMHIMHIIAVPLSWMYSSRVSTRFSHLVHCSLGTDTTGRVQAADVHTSQEGTTARLLLEVSAGYLTRAQGAIHLQPVLVALGTFHSGLYRFMAGKVSSRTVLLSDIKLRRSFRVEQILGCQYKSLITVT
jgi:hypothetical protein